MKQSLKPTECRIKRFLMNALILGFLSCNIAHAMGQETPDEKKLQAIYHTPENYVVLDRQGWERKVVTRGCQQVVELQPDSASSANGSLIKEVREIHKVKNAYILKKHYEPSQGLACVLGSALVAGAAYCWYWYSHGNLVNN